jgi:hypothetical protein
MELTEEDLKEFARIWQEEFSETLPEAEMRQRASELMELYLVLAKPLPTTHQKSPEQPMGAS